MENKNQKEQQQSQEQQIKKFDLNGFQKKSNEVIKMNQGDLKQINARIQKWRAMIQQLPQQIKNKQTNSKLKQRVRKGIPQAMRTIVWPILAEIIQLQQQSQLDYSDLIKQNDFPYKFDIAVDLPRTFPNHQMFSSQIQNNPKHIEKENNQQKIKDQNVSDNIYQNQVNQQNEQQTLGQLSLQNVLKALSLAFPKMGYCQGLNFIAASLLIYVNDEEAFWMLYSLMQKYNCKDIYENVASIHRNVFVFESLLKKFMPKLFQHLTQIGIETLYYATSWFMTLYSSVLPFNLFARVFDIFLVEHYKIIYRIGLAMLKFKQNQLIQATNMDQVMEIIRDYDYYQQVGEDEFINCACTFIFSKKIIFQLEEEFNNNNITSRSDNQPLQKYQQ